MRKTYVKDENPALESLSHAAVASILSTLLQKEENLSTKQQVHHVKKNADRKVYNTNFRIIMTYH